MLKTDGKFTFKNFSRLCLLCNLVIMALTALLTIWINMSPSMSTGCDPGFVSSCFWKKKQHGKRYRDFMAESTWKKIFTRMGWEHWPSLSLGEEPTFLCQVMYSSRNTALSKLANLYWGCTKHRAEATIAAVSGPVTPVDVKNSAIFGVNLNGTGLLASGSPRK